MTMIMTMVYHDKCDKKNNCFVVVLLNTICHKPNPKRPGMEMSKHLDFSMILSLFHPLTNKC